VKLVAPTLAGVARITDGQEWLEKRLRFLQEELGRTTDEINRVAIQAELDVVRGDLERTQRARGWQWILGGRLPHQQD
jgi:hypothetical protein